MHHRKTYQQFESGLRRLLINEGSVMPGRSFSSEAYRFGFNTQEKDDEIYGAGNSYTALYWQYDARIGRRWNIDPVPQVFISDYACFKGNPLWYIDRLGDKVDPTDDKSKDATNNYIESFSIQKGNKTKSGGELFKITIDENGHYSSSLNLSEKAFKKRATKHGLEGEKLNDAVAFYKLLQTEDLLKIRSISENETEHDFYNKGNPIQEKNRVPLFFEPTYNYAIWGPRCDPKRAVATNESINRGLLAGIVFGENWYVPWEYYDEGKTLTQMLIINLTDVNISNTVMQSAFRVAFGQNGYMPQQSFSRRAVKDMKRN